MQESNISGLLGMSRSNDNDSDYDFNNRNDYKSRQNRHRKHYIESGYKTKMGIDLDIDTGEILNFVPKALKNMAYNNRRNYRSSGVKIPDLSKLLPFAMYGAIGLAGYKIYQHFFGQTASDIRDNKSDAGSKALANTYVDTSSAKVDSLNRTTSSLLNKGLVVSDLHKSLANTFHDMLDSLWVDHSKIVATILKQNVQTFRLVSVAYGTRSLNTYGNSLAHIFTGDVWSLSSSLFSDKKLTGMLKDHLKLVLTSDELSKIHAYYSVIQ